MNDVHGFDFDLVRRMPYRSAERQSIYLSLTGTAGQYGEVTVTVRTVTRQATLAGPGLPEASVSHPDDLKQGLILIDERTGLSVDGRQATLTWNRRSLGKEGRGIRIGLGDRDSFGSARERRNCVTPNAARSSGSAIASVDLRSE
ncbi:hypothetical protein AB0B54_11490 [Microbispora bryophytorum]|uniref:hypothetical protein n=1 Tax=Microbispora bryophytorum TaxID=1460882 RepID=UPI0033F724B0